MSVDEQAEHDPSDTSILPILRTKLYVPQPRPNTIPRPHLIEQIHSAILANRRLILLSAPAGFGKSTLLTDWAAHSDCTLAWYSLDESDNDRTRFLTYLIASLQEIKPEIGVSAVSMQQSPHPPPLEEVLTSLINDLLEWRGHLAIVLDDYHLILERDVHRTVEFLLDHLPAGIHFIIASRSEPPFSIARLRVRNTFQELNENDLRFRERETAAFLKDIAGLDLSLEQISLLKERTEGWVAGLQMAALSLQRQTDIPAFLQNLSGTNRFIGDYLMEEVLDHQPAVIQTFMLKTSILDQLSGPLCDEVIGGDFKQQLKAEFDLDPDNLPAGGSPGQALLEHLERQNLFILPLDDERRWYRYHQLFTELLRDQLTQKQPDQVGELNLRASKWCERNGRLSDAVRHALAAGDHTRAAKLVGQHALALVYRGNLATLARWLEALPAEIKKLHPWLNIAHAWALTFAGQLDRVATLIQDAEESLDSIDDQIERKRISGIIDALRAYLLAIRGSMSLASEFAREALKLLPDEDLILRGFSAMLLATVLRWNGDLSEAIEAYQVAIAINQRAGDYNVLVESLCDLAELQALHGELDRSMQTCEKALELGMERYSQTGVRLHSHGYAHVRLSEVFLERNKLESARDYALEGLALIEDWGQAELLLRVYLVLARVLKACGEGEGAQAALRDAKRLAVDLSPWYIARVEAQQARLALDDGDLETASRWAQGTLEDLGNKVEFQNFDTYLALVRTYIAGLVDANAPRDPDDRILSLLDALLALSERSGAKKYQAETLILDTLRYDAIGEFGKSMESLEKALELGEAHGFVRLFLDERRQLEPLLLELQTSTGTRETQYLDELLREFRADTLSERTRTSQPLQLIVEPLSERELEVLGYLETHLTSGEIAEVLSIAVSTVRSHIKSIYSKLNVHNRNEAVLRAQELELI